MFKIREKVEQGIKHLSMHCYIKSNVVNNYIRKRGSKQTFRIYPLTVSKDVLNKLEMSNAWLNFLMYIFLAEKGRA